MQLEQTEHELRVILSEEDLRLPATVYSEFERIIIDECERIIIVDLSRANMLDSLMIGTLVSIHLLAYENLARLTFDGLGPKMQELLKMVGVDSLFKAHNPDLKSGL